MKVEGSCVKVDFYDDILSGMTPEQKRELATMLVWDDDILENVVSDLMGSLATSHFNSNIHKVRLQMRSLLPDMSIELVASLLEEVEHAKAEANRQNEWAWLLYRLIVDNNDSLYHLIPAIPAWQNLPKWDEMRAKAKELLESREAQ